MNSKDFIQTLEDGKNVFLESTETVHVAMTKHPNGTYVYMDVPRGIFVTCDEIRKEAEHEILGFVGGIPTLTIKTEKWFA